MDQSNPVKAFPSLECGGRARTCKRDDCTLWPIIPDQHKAERLPCHHIPLDSSYETIASIREKGDSDHLQAKLLEWIRELPLSKKTLVWESALWTALLYEIQPMKEQVERWLGEFI